MDEYNERRLLRIETKIDYLIGLVAFAFAIWLFDFVRGAAIHTWGLSSGLAEFVAFICCLGVLALVRRQVEGA